MKFLWPIFCLLISTSTLAAQPTAKTNPFNTPPATLEDHLKGAWVAHRTDPPQIRSDGCVRMEPGKNFTPSDLNCHAVVADIDIFSEGTGSTTTLVYLMSRPSSLPHTGSIVFQLLVLAYDLGGYNADRDTTFVQQLISAKVANLQTDAASYAGKILPHSGPPPLNEDSAMIFIYPRN